MTTHISTILLCLLVFSRAMIHEFKNETVLQSASKDLNETMYNLIDAPSGKDDPFVEVSVTFIKHSSILDAFIYIGFQDTVPPVCASAVERNTTTELVSLVYDKDEKEKEVLVVVRLPVNRTGRYHVRVTNCDHVSTFSITGQFVWYNPYGYLPGDLYMKLPVAGVLAILYMITTVAYMIPMVMHRKTLLYIQIGIFVVFVVGVIEISAWYFYRRGKNEDGVFSSQTLMVVVFIANLKRTATRVLILLMAMGVGITKWTIGNAKIKLALLAVAHLCFTFLLELIREHQAVGQPAKEWIFFSVLVPAAFFETCFYYWIILSLIRTIQQLTLRRQTLKLTMYKWFFGVLAATGVMTAAFGIYLAVLTFNTHLINWRSTWIQDMFWEFLFLFVMVCIAILWRPRANNSRYGYAEYFSDESVPEQYRDDESQIQLETLEVVSGGELNQRRRGDAPPKPINETRYETEREENIAKATGPLDVIEESFIRSSEYFDLPDSSDGEDVSLDTQLRKLD